MASKTATAASVSEEELRSKFEACGQGHVFKFAEGLTSDERSGLFSQLQGIDPARVNSLFQASTTAKSVRGTPEPVKKMTAIATAEASDVARWLEKGLLAICAGKVGVIIMAGGQGTRLGFDRPKGEYDICLPSSKSLFQLSAERLLKLQQLADAKYGYKFAEEPTIKLYIMTSPMTHEPTVAYWKKMRNFGLEEDQVFFFQQGVLPCLTESGKIILESGSKVAMAPDGNGGIYMGLHTQGAIKHMLHNGVESIYVGAVDNAVSKVGDPVFIGYCREQNADVGNKVCTKVSPEEKVGVQCMRDGVPAVIEYSDLDPKLAAKRDDAGELVFRAGNVCMHYYHIDFLTDTCQPSKLSSEYHVAKKKIPHADAEGKTIPKSELAANTGIKLEAFIFDVFSEAKNLVVFEVSRGDEFSPVKNKPGSAVDSPDSARGIISALHRSWLTKAGATCVDTAGEESVCEISPFVSYQGEGLNRVSGRTLRLPLLIQLAHETTPDPSKFVLVANLGRMNGKDVLLFSRPKPSDRAMLRAHVAKPKDASDITNVADARAEIAALEALFERLDSDAKL